MSVLSLCLLVAVIGCGKKSENKAEKGIQDVTPGDPQTLPADFEALLNSQSVICENNQACPNYLAKIVTINGNKVNYCTGFLTDENVIATSSSCLPDILRLSGQDCSKDVFVFFPKTSNRPFERVGCKTVLQASDLSAGDPVLWRDDISFLQLSKSLAYRRAAEISREGVGIKKTYTSWMIEQQDEKDAIVRKVTCETVHSSYINPLSLNESSPGSVLSGCAAVKGSTGAPFVDSKGKVRAVISKGLDPKIRSYLESTPLLTNGLKEMIHATNFACAPTPSSDEVLDERECRKNLFQTDVDRMRSEMFSTNILFSDLKKKYEDSLKDLSQYIKVGVKLIPRGDTQNTEIYPKCFKPINDWLPSLSRFKTNYTESVKFPVKTFRRVMDNNGKVLGESIDGETKNGTFTFSVKTIRSDKKSAIQMTIQDGTNILFQNVTEACSNSLL